jgi:hypothetical protein
VGNVVGAVVKEEVQESVVKKKEGDEEERISDCPVALSAICHPKGEFEG